jgi:hypothetical protein
MERNRRKNIIPPKEEELSPLERVSQRFFEHLKDVSLEDKRFLAFVDHVKLSNSYPVYMGKPKYNEDEVRETIKHRMKKVPGHEDEHIPGYEEEYTQVWRIANDYWDSNNSPPPLMVTMTPFGNMAPQSKETCILQKYIEFLH